MSKASDDKHLHAAIHEDIEICSYDPTWPDKFLQEKNRLLSIFAPEMFEIEHIGSTAVPGLDSKPIIDIMASVASMAVADELLDSLRDFGYFTPPECNSSLTDRRWLMRQAEGHRTHHLHLVIAGSEGWNRTIKFRNILRTKPEVRKAYLALKTDLAIRAGKDRDLYVNGKTPFISEMVKRYFYEKDPETFY